MGEYKTDTVASNMKPLMKSGLSRKARLLYDEICNYGYDIYYVPAHFGYYGVNNAFEYSKLITKEGNKETFYQKIFVDMGVTHSFTILHYKNNDGYEYDRKAKFVVISTGAIRIWNKFHNQKYGMVLTLSHELAHIRLFEDKFLKAQHYYNYFEDPHNLRFQEVYTNICNEYNIKYTDESYLD